MNEEERRRSLARVADRRRLAIDVGLLGLRASQERNQVLLDGHRPPVIAGQVGRAKEADDDLNATRLVRVAALAFQSIGLFGDTEQASEMAARGEAQSAYLL